MFLLLLGYKKNYTPEEGKAADTLFTQLQQASGLGTSPAMPTQVVQKTYDVIWQLVGAIYTAYDLLNPVPTSIILRK